MKTLRISHLDWARIPMKITTQLCVLALILLMLTGCDNGTDYPPDKAVLNNIDRNLAVLNLKIDKLNSKLDKTNALLVNLDKNIVVISTHTAAIANIRRQGHA